ncbi:helix-turn-helix domain-containing protein [Emticicia sp. ODNR4P]|nr:helix-turn-helix domain-containing protein [Emticicia sp. ODNR4P]
MKYIFEENSFHSYFSLLIEENKFEHIFYDNREERLLTIVWNRGESQQISIDGNPYNFPKNTILPLMVNQSFWFEKPQNLVIWRFNREFYCIVDHDKEVSCVGFLFYGMREITFFQLSAENLQRFESLRTVFIDEFSTIDTIQGEMLRMLLKRLIILVTRIAKEQSIQPPMEEQDFDIVRRYNIAVENHYKSKHQVQDYADMLSKSPKTLSNLFALYNHKSPLQIIHERITLEAKRLLIFTEKPTKEIAFDLGFEEVAHFSRLFKKVVGNSPTEFKEKHFRNYA